MSESKITIPTDGRKITMGPDGRLCVPDRPIIPFIEGDGTGPDITRAAMTAWNAAVEKAYGGKRRVAWMEIYAGEKANAVYGPGTWLPAETIDAIRAQLREEGAARGSVAGVDEDAPVALDHEEHVARRAERAARGRIGVAAVARDREDRRRDGLLRVLVDAQLEALAREAGGRRFGDGGRGDEQRGREEGSFRSVHGVAEWTRGDHGAVFA